MVLGWLCFAVKWIISGTTVVEYILKMRSWLQNCRHTSALVGNKKLSNFTSTLLDYFYTYPAIRLREICVLGWGTDRDLTLLLSHCCDISILCLCCGVQPRLLPGASALVPELLVWDLPFVETGNLWSVGTDGGFRVSLPARLLIQALGTMSVWGVTGTWSMAAARLCDWSKWNILFAAPWFRNLSRAVSLFPGSLLNGLWSNCPAKSLWQSPTHQTRATVNERRLLREPLMVSAREEKHRV